jgi:hypothetical protein
MAACSRELRSIAEEEDDDEEMLDSSELIPDNDPIDALRRRLLRDRATHSVAPPDSITTKLLQEFENGLLCLVGLLESGHTRRLQYVVLRHVAYGLSYVGIHDRV